MLRHLSQPQKGNEGTFVLCDILQSHLIKAFIVLISQTKVLNLRVNHGCHVFKIMELVSSLSNRLKEIESSYDRKLN